MAAELLAVLANVYEEVVFLLDLAGQVGCLSSVTWSMKLLMVALCLGRILASFAATGIEPEEEEPMVVIVQWEDFERVSFAASLVGPNVVLM